MSLWGVHIGLAVIITTSVAAYLRVPLPERWVFISSSGLLATIPDWWWIFTDRFIIHIQNPLLAQVYKAVLHDSFLANLFWFHGVIDMLGTDNVLPSVVVSTSAVAIFLLFEYYSLRESTDLN